MAIQVNSDRLTALLKHGPNFITPSANAKIVASIVDRAFNLFAKGEYTIAANCCDDAALECEVIAADLRHLRDTIRELRYASKAGH